MLEDIILKVLAVIGIILPSFVLGKMLGAGTSPNIYQWWTIGMLGVVFLVGLYIIFQVYTITRKENEVEKKADNQA